MKRYVDTRIPSTAANKRKIVLRSTYLDVPKNDDSVCRDTCILYRYNNGYLLIELYDSTYKPCRIWRTQQNVVYPFNSRYKAICDFHDILRNYRRIFANNLEPLRYCELSMNSRPQIIPIHTHEIRNLIDELTSTRQSELGCINNNNDDDENRYNKRNCHKKSKTQPADKSFNFYKSLDPTITYKDYLRIVGSSY
ncbi:hypothetical protein HT594_00089 [Phenacoccus solenopsis nudivirus]|nr:hypothetical protein HT594_00089 [Phenacoccus solenopsis nudivirus]